VATWCFHTLLPNWAACFSVVACGRISWALILGVGAVAWLRVLIVEAVLDHLRNLVVRWVDFRIGIGVPKSWTSEIARRFASCVWPWAMMNTRFEDRLTVSVRLNFWIIDGACLVGAGANVVKCTHPVVTTGRWWGGIATSLVQFVGACAVKDVRAFVVPCLSQRGVDDIACRPACEDLQVGTLLVTIQHYVPVVECHRENAIRATIEAMTCSSQRGAVVVKVAGRLHCDIDSKGIS